MASISKTANTVMYELITAIKRQVIQFSVTGIIKKIPTFMVEMVL
jgi:hypothetical protein